MKKSPGSLKLWKNLNSTRCVVFRDKMIALSWKSEWFQSSLAVRAILMFFMTRSTKPLLSKYLLSLTLSSHPKKVT